MRSEEYDRSGMVVKTERSTQSDDSDVGNCKNRCAFSLEIDEGRLL